MLQSKRDVLPSAAPEAAAAAARAAPVAGLASVVVGAAPSAAAVSLGVAAAAAAEPVAGLQLLPSCCSIEGLLLLASGNVAASALSRRPPEVIVYTMLYSVERGAERSWLRLEERDLLLLWLPLPPPLSFKTLSLLLRSWLLLLLRFS